MSAELIENDQDSLEGIQSDRMRLTGREGLDSVVHLLYPRF
jgi:hypothetical protein